MKNLNKFQMFGIAFGILGLIPIFIVVFQVAAQPQGQVSGGPEVIAWIMKMFGGGGTVTLSGVIAFIYGLIQKYKGLPADPAAPAALGINTGGATPAELIELALASTAFISNSKSKPAQYRFAAAVAGVVDVVPGMQAQMDGGTLVTRLRLFADADVTPVPVPPVKVVPVPAV